MTKRIEKITDLQPDQGNANLGTERGQYMLDESIAQVGAARSIVTDRDGVVIAGNKTLQAAVDAGLGIQVVQTDGNELVVVQRTDLDLDGEGDEQERARLAAYFDNRASEVGLSWDAEQIAADIAAGMDFGPMFGDDELVEILSALAPEPEPDPGAQIDKAAELQQKWGTALGQLWEVGRHRIVCGDCTDAAVVEKLMQGEKAGAVVTDPPYGQNQLGVPGDAPEESIALLNGVLSVLPMSNGVCAAFQSPRTFPVWLDAVRAHGHVFERALWLYKEAQESFPWRGWILKSEMILLSTVGKPGWVEVHPYSHDCYKLAEVSFKTEAVGAVRMHGSIKPIVVVLDLVARATPPGAIAYDPFLGSGTTLVACEQLGRIGRGIEIEPKYVAVSLERLAGMGLEPRPLNT